MTCTGRHLHTETARWVPWLAVLLVAALSACAPAPAEQRLREALGGLQEAIETREIRDAMNYIADDFIGNQSLDQAGVRNLLRVQLLRHQSLGVSLGPATFEIQGGRATVRFTAVATGGSGSLLPESARIWDVETGWREDDSEWKLISARWD